MCNPVVLVPLFLTCNMFQKVLYIRGQALGPDSSEALRTGSSESESLEPDASESLEPGCVLERYASISEFKSGLSAKLASFEDPA